ncbi:hypothetical protein B7463_g2842, partial [Scytalidium lignicola]
MQFKPVILALGLVSAVQAWANGTVYTTITTDYYTTVCPSPTTFVAGNQTYTVTESTTLTITNCPCTISKPVSTPVAPPSTFYGNSTIPAPPPASTIASTGLVPPPTTPTTGAPSSSPTGPGFSSGASIKEASYGAMVIAGLAAMFL